jgi:hypothetical protein
MTLWVLPNFFCQQFRVKSFIVSQNGRDVRELSDPDADTTGWSKKEGKNCAQPPKLGPMLYDF